MTFPLLKASHYIGLALLLGGPAFWYWITAERGRPGSPGRAGLPLWLAGFALFVTTGLLDAVRAAAELYGSASLEDVLFFLANARYGRIIVLKSALAVVFFLLALPRPASRWSRLLVLLVGAGVVCAVSATGHAAASGWFGFLADAIHVAAMAAWGGALVHFALWLWRTAPSTQGPAQPHAMVAAQAQRFARLGTAAVAALAATGALMSVRLIYGLPALTATPYGSALLVKLGVFAALLAVAAANHFVFVPALERESAGQQGGGRQAAARWFRYAVAGETLLLLLVLGATGVLTTGIPPREPQVLAQPIHATGRLGTVTYELHASSQATGGILFTLRLHDAEGRPVQGPALPMELTMPDHVMPPYHAALRPSGPGEYRTELILPMSGRWRIAIDASAVAPNPAGIAFELRAGTSPREAQQVWYFTWYRALRWPAGVLWLIVYIAMAGFAVHAIRTAGAKRSFRPLRVGAQLLLFFSLWQLVSLFVAKGYPTADNPNPVPATADVVAAGQALFQTYCAQCHGTGARGDGPLAGEMWPPPSDLTVFAPMHTDGELFWFITKGVPGTEMPAFETVLTEEERWTVVRYLRSLPATDPRAARLNRHQY
ncbi:MAG TPA: FixH family protein [Limnochordales bacterium]